jgi:hypothetical protein
VLANTPRSVPVEENPSITLNIDGAVALITAKCFLLPQFKEAGRSWGCVSAVDSCGRTIWIADAHRGDGKRFVVQADEKLTAFLELERAVSIHLLSEQC